MISPTAPLPSAGESARPEAEFKVTRDLIRAGQLMKIDALDHVITEFHSLLLAVARLFFRGAY